MPPKQNSHEPNQCEGWQEYEDRLAHVCAALQITRGYRIDPANNPPHDALIKGAPAHPCAVYASHPHQKHPQEEEALVVEPNTAVREGTVVVHSQNAPPAHTAVVGPWGLGRVARLAHALFSLVGRAAPPLDGTRPQRRVAGARENRREVGELDKGSKHNAEAPLLVVNCAGLWGGKLAGDDTSVVPNRGQIVRVTPPRGRPTLARFFLVDHTAEGSVSYVLLRCLALVVALVLVLVVLVVLVLVLVLVLVGGGGGRSPRREVL